MASEWVGSTDKSVKSESRPQAGPAAGETIGGASAWRLALLRRRRVLIVIGQIAILAGLLGIWEFTARVGLVNEFFVSTPSGVAQAATTIYPSDLFLRSLFSTIQGAILGFTVGAVAGIVIGLALARWPTAGTLFDPVIIGLNSMPRVALAPLFILWFGIGLQGKGLLAASVVVFIVLGTTRSGVKNVDPDLVAMSRLMGATGNQTFRKVIVPTSVPAIFSGLRLGAVYALLGVVVSEIVAAQQGLGVLLTQYANTFAISETFAILLVLAAIAMTLTFAIDWVERHLLRWRTEG